MAISRTSRKPQAVQTPSKAGARNGARQAGRRSATRDAGKHSETSGARKEKVGEYLIIIERGKRNYGAYVPDVDGCVATGRTVAETVKNMREALAFHFEGMAEDGETIPEPTSQSAYVEVRRP